MPILATGALCGAASYRVNRLLRKVIHNKGFELKPYSASCIKLTPYEINGLIEYKDGGLLPVLASIAAFILPMMLGNGLTRFEIFTAKDVITTVGRLMSKKMRRRS